MAGLTLTAILATAALSALAQQDEGPILLPKTLPVKPASATLLVMCDLACNWNLDGEPKGHIQPEGSAKAKVELGQHIVIAVTEDGADQVRQISEVKSTGQTALALDLKPVRAARLKAEQEARDKAARDALEKAAQDARDKAAAEERDKATREQQEKEEKEQVQTPHAEGAGSVPIGSATRARVTIPSAKSVEALRKENAVRALQPLEDDEIVSSLPGGVYGFTVPWIINTNASGIVGGTGVDKLGLRRSSGGTFVMEIHKLHSGEVYVVGYLSESDLARLQNPSRTSSAKATLFFSPYLEYSLAVAIPLSRITSSRFRSVEKIYANDISVGVLGAPKPK